MSRVHSDWALKIATSVVAVVAISATWEAVESRSRPTPDRTPTWRASESIIDSGGADNLLGVFGQEYDPHSVVVILDPANADSDLLVKEAVEANSENSSKFVYVTEHKGGRMAIDNAVLAVLCALRQRPGSDFLILAQGKSMHAFLAGNETRLRALTPDPPAFDRCLRLRESWRQANANIVLAAALHLYTLPSVIVDGSVIRDRIGRDSLRTRITRERVQNRVKR